MREPAVDALLIRGATSADWTAVRELCCLTGAGGKPIDRARWPFFAEQWIGPYQRLLPDWAYVACDAAGVVRGYLTGCPDSRAFRWRSRLLFTAPLLLRIALGGGGDDARRFFRRALRLENHPEREFPREVRARLDREFPAHLHVNVDESLRGGGVGRKLIARFREELERRAIPGIHVFCGAGPVKFYEALGFRELAAIDFRKRGSAETARVHCLGLRIPKS